MLRFIGHLDFLRVVQQTIRRAELPAAFSQGFNPHLLISFALPLPLGMESVNDYADLTLENEMPRDELLQKLNAAAPEGLFFKDAYPAKNKAASVVSVADYSVAAIGDIEKILHAKEIIIAKKTKKGIKDTDIRADILNLREENNLTIMRLSAGSARFLNPMTVAEIFCEEKPPMTAISRLELFQETESGELITL